MVIQNPTILSGLDHFIAIKLTILKPNYSERSTSELSGIRMVIFWRHSGFGMLYF
jgi:hypothetical protein